MKAARDFEEHWAPYTGWVHTPSQATGANTHTHILHTHTHTHLTHTHILHTHTSYTHTHTHAHAHVQCSLLTVPSVTTPWSSTTLGWWNWPMMAASCRNLTLSIMVALDLSVLIATSRGLWRSSRCHSPRCTLPNWPDPSCSRILWDKRKKWV